MYRLTPSSLTNGPKELCDCDFLRQGHGLLSMCICIPTDREQYTDGWLSVAANMTETSTPPSPSKRLLGWDYYSQNPWRATSWVESKYIIIQNNFSFELLKRNENHSAMRFRRSKIMQVITLPKSNLYRIKTRISKILASFDYILYITIGTNL